MAITRKEALKKVTDLTTLWTDKVSWTVHLGKLKRRPGRPSNTKSLFKVVAEKLPYESLNKVAASLSAISDSAEGIYIAHDSMGCPRYIGRGNVINRLKARLREQPLELKYFSFYIVEEKKHEREIETLLIRAAAHLLYFNDRKKRPNIEAGDIKDYEAGTQYFERHRKKGRRGHSK